MIPEVRGHSVCKSGIMSQKQNTLDFIKDLSDFESLAIVGLEKNTGKTECLNYILRKIGDRAGCFALTSVGIDGESRDQVCQTPKPEIEVPEGMVFVTSEKHYLGKKLIAEVLEVSEKRTALGRLVTARAKSSGKILLSGPSDTSGLKAMISRMSRFGVRTTIVDGALSRLSPASPAVTEAMVLTTGAAVSGNIPELIRRTKYIYELIGLEEVEPELQARLELKEKGVWAVDEKERLMDLYLPSVFMLEQKGTDLFQYGHRLYVAGAVSDKLLQYLRAQKQTVELIVRDFTRIFATPESYYAFLRKGCCLKVLHRSKLLAITVNPVSPSGLVLDSGGLCSAIRAALQIPVYDVKKME